MPTLIIDPDLEQDLIEKRKAWGGDKFDEVWDGVYVMAAWPNDEHQFLVKEITTILTLAVDWQILPLNWQLLSDVSGRAVQISHQQSAEQTWRIEIT